MEKNSVLHSDARDFGQLCSASNLSMGYWMIIACAFHSMMRFDGFSKTDSIETHRVQLLMIIEMFVVQVQGFCPCFTWIYVTERTRGNVFRHFSRSYMRQKQGKPILDPSRRNASRRQCHRGRVIFMPYIALLLGKLKVLPASANGFDNLKLLQALCLIPTAAATKLTIFLARRPDPAYVDSPDYFWVYLINWYIFWLFLTIFGFEWSFG